MLRINKKKKEGRRRCPFFGISLINESKLVVIKCHSHIPLCHSQRRKRSFRRTLHRNTRAASPPAQTKIDSDYYIILRRWLRTIYFFFFVLFFFFFSVLLILSTGENQTNKFLHFASHPICGCRNRFSFCTSASANSFSLLVYSSFALSFNQCRFVCAFCCWFLSLYILGIYSVG